MLISLSEKRIEQIFDVGIALKGINGLLEVLAGTLLSVLSPSQIGGLAQWLILSELTEDPNGRLTNLFLNTAMHITTHGKFVSAVFLLSHGSIKLFLVYQLFRGRLWAYLLTIGVLLFFIGFQIFEIVQMHSRLLTALTILDACIILLAWHEYKVRREAMLKVQLLSTLKTS